ncbi:YD repeat protein, partial [Pseudomonas sp. CFII68]
MTTSSVVHSQAFGFMSYVQGGVDPRTGQYTVSIDLPEVQSNWLCGPA